MRSLLFVPADDDRKIDKALASGADAVILDLEDSVALPRKALAREAARRRLLALDGVADRPRLVVRLNALDTGLTDADLSAVIAGRPDMVMLPKALGGRSIVHLGAMLAVAEAEAGVEDGRTRILAIATETAAAIFEAGTYAGSSHRLDGLAWGAEDLSADLGAEANRDASGWRTPYRLARDTCLMAAASAQVMAIDTVFVAFRDLDGLRFETEEARIDGFTAKMAIHPAQVPVINEVFTPSPEAVAHARAIVDAFAADPGAGVVGINGQMIDRPHLLRARRTLARVKGKVG